jgi:hypothetical protein
METDRLRTMLGNDYSRVEDMRTWIQSHARRLEILARLARRK